MKKLTEPSLFGTMVEPTTLRIERVLPGPIERVWSYLTDAELRRQWLGSGVMELRAGAPFEMVWRNSELTIPPGARPEGFSEEHRMQSRVVVVEPPRLLVFTWGEQQTGEVTMELAAEGEQVRLTVTHRRIVDRRALLSIGPGWHAHLDLLVNRVSGTTPHPHWDHFNSLRVEYATRLSAT